MAKLSLSKKSSSQLLASMQITPLEFKGSAASEDLTDPNAVRQWVIKMYGGTSYIRPAGIIVELFFYTNSSSGKSSPQKFWCSLSSFNKQAATTNKLNYYVQFPKNLENSADFYAPSYYSFIEHFKKSKVEKIVKFAKNVLRLLKGTQYYNKHEKFLVGNRTTIKVSLEMAALMKTTESLRDVRSLFLGIEFYKLKKGQLTIEQVLDPLKGSFIPARKAIPGKIEGNKITFSKNIKAKKKKEAEKMFKTSIAVKNESELEENPNEGGADQMRQLSNNYIKRRFLDKHMQKIFMKKFSGQVFDSQEFGEWALKKWEKWNQLFIGKVDWEAYLAKKKREQLCSKALGELKEAEEEWLDSWPKDPNILVCSANIKTYLKRCGREDLQGQKALSFLSKRLELAREEWESKKLIIKTTLDSKFDLPFRREQCYLKYCKEEEAVERSTVIWCHELARLNLTMAQIHEQFFEFFPEKRKSFEEQTKVNFWSEKIRD